MRKSFDTLFALAKSQIGIDPLSGHLFVFSNRLRNRLKILYWDGSGLWVCAKRLEKGTFHWPKADLGTTSITLRHEQLSLLLGGLDLKDTRQRRWWRKDIAG
jgi:transposase